MLVLKQQQRIQGLSWPDKAHAHALLAKPQLGSGWRGRLTGTSYRAACLWVQRYGQSLVRLHLCAEPGRADHTAMRRACAACVWQGGGGGVWRPPGGRVKL